MSADMTKLIYWMLAVGHIPDLPYPSLATSPANMNVHHGLSFFHLAKWHQYDVRDLWHHIPDLDLGSGIHYHNKSIRENMNSGKIIKVLTTKYMGWGLSLSKCFYFYIIHRSKSTYHHPVPFLYLHVFSWSINLEKKKKIQINY